MRFCIGCEMTTIPWMSRLSAALSVRKEKGKRAMGLLEITSFNLLKKIYFYNQILGMLNAYYISEK